MKKNIEKLKTDRKSILKCRYCKTVFKPKKNNSYHLNGFDKDICFINYIMKTFKNINNYLSVYEEHFEDIAEKIEILGDKDKKIIDYLIKQKKNKNG